MSLIDFDSWITESEAVERTLFEIQTQIGQINNESGTGLPQFSKTELTKKVRQRLGQSSKDLTALVRKLEGNNGNPITRDETERRQRKLEELQTQHFLLNKSFNESTHGSISGSISRPDASLWDAPSSSTTSARISSDPTQGFSRDQMLRNQDEGLENLSKIISRQKNIALKISQEVEEQDEILDDIAVQMENTDGRINHGTQAIQTFTEKDNSFCLWMIILGLFVAIVIVWFI